MFTSLAYVRGFDWLAVFEVLCVRKVSLISNETFIPKWQKRYVIKTFFFNVQRSHEMSAYQL